MNRIHIIVNDDVMKLLEYYNKNNNYSYSKTINEFVELAINKKTLIDEAQKISTLVNNINNKQFLILDLLKQLYSDLEIENSTNPNKNKALADFFYKRNIGHDN